MLRETMKTTRITVLTGNELDSLSLEEAKDLMVHVRKEVNRNYGVDTPVFFERDEDNELMLVAVIRKDF